MSAIDDEVVYGAPPGEIAAAFADARQVSPLVPTAARLEEIPPGHLSRVCVDAPGNTLERRYVLALALRSLRRDGELIALARKDRGGLRLRGELEAFGCDVEQQAKTHHRICRCGVPAAGFREDALGAAIAEGGLQFAEPLGLWSQPGLFSWNRLDEGAALLSATLPPMAGRGADFGCGSGVLGGAILRSSTVAGLASIDIDARAVAAARKNIADARATFLQADLGAPGEETIGSGGKLDFVVTNPPFHRRGHRDLTIAGAFVRTAARVLKPGGRLLMVANAALPYEAELRASFGMVRQIARADGFKVLEARL